ncbi:MAG: C-type polyheme cytochrome OmcB [Nitrospirae bacterium]|nr:C-type polyheme cytochrome OmcB [Nitrospirota bacterium]
MSTRKFSIIMLCMLSLAVFLYGCGSSSRDGSASGTPETVGEVGDTACFQCHAATADPLTGDTFIEQYQRSLHAELGCESCHGGGAQHNGIGPFPYTLNSGVSDAQKAERCAMCHNGVTEFKGKVAPLSSSPNFQNGNHANPFSAEEAHEAKCSRCHSHEGAVLQGTAGFTGDKTILNNAAYEPVLPRNPETFNTIRCGTCHEHGGNLRQWTTRDANGNIVAWDPNKNFINDQIDLCTGCHTLTTNDGVLIGSGNILTIATGTDTSVDVPTAPFYHNTAWYRTLPSTHYDQPASIAVAGGVIEGYNVRKVSETVKNPCFDCHGHEYKTNTRALAGRPERGGTIFTDWAQSGHAGELLSQKVAAAASAADRTVAQVDAVMKAGVTEESGVAWIHYNWDNSTGISGDDRKACQRCHTSTGVSNFLNNPTTYDPVNNSFTHLSGWTNSNKTSPQNELLYCWGCHSNAGTGQLRDPGPLTFVYTNNATATYPDVGHSNVCVACHTGRETGDSIKNFPATTDFSNRSFINSHYLSGGGTVFEKTGYTYGDRSYDSTPNGFLHDMLGVSATGVAAADAYIADNNLSKSGPCAVCHMTSQELGRKSSHAFSPFTEYAAGDVALNPVCVNCHPTRGAGTNAKVTWFEGTWKLRLDAALDALSAQLALKGFNFTTGYPYFSNKNWLSPGDTDKTGDTTGKHNMGAAFNFNLLVHDPGAVAHNRYYTRRVIYDSIDWIDDNTLNYSVGATLNALDPEVALYKADAITFLINGGVPTGAETERF